MDLKERVGTTGEEYEDMQTTSIDYTDSMSLEAEDAHQKNAGQQLPTVVHRLRPQCCHAQQQCKRERSLHARLLLLYTPQTG